LPGRGQACLAIRTRQGYEYEKDKYVVIDDEDIKKMAPKTGRVMAIQEFVKITDVDPIFFESSYYVAPEDAGEKPYALLFEALRKSGYVSWVLRRPPNSAAATDQHHGKVHPLS